MTVERRSRESRLLTASGLVVPGSAGPAWRWAPGAAVGPAVPGPTAPDPSGTIPVPDPRESTPLPALIGLGPVTVTGADRLAPPAGVMNRLRRVAAGEEEADLIVRGGLVVVVHSGAVVARDILIVGRYIAAVTKPGTLSGRRSLDAAGRYVLPAYVDAGLRVEDTLLTPGELARLVVPRGTVTVLADPAGLVAIGGPRGAELATGSATPLRVLVRSGGTPAPEAAAASLAGLSATSVAALPSPPPSPLPPTLPTAVPTAPALGGLPPVGTVPAKPAAEVAAPRRPGDDPVAGRGVRSRSLTELATVGHLDHDVRVAVSRGAEAIDAIREVSLSPSRAHGLEATLGSIAPARLADLQIVSSLVASAPPDVVLAGGRIAAEGGRPLFDNVDTSPEWAIGRVRLPASLYAGSFSPPALRRAGRRDPSIAAVSIDLTHDAIVPPPGDMASRAMRMGRAGHLAEPTARRAVRTVRVEPTLHAGAAVADVSRDLLKVAVFEQDGSHGRLDVGMLRGCGLARGALAVTTAQSPGHLVAVGVRDDDLLTAMRAVEGMGGGFVVVDHGWVRAACPLPLLGMMSDAPWEAVLGELAAVDTAAADLGCRLPFPLRTLARLGPLLYTQP